MSDDMRTISLTVTVTCPSRLVDGWTDEDVAGLIAACLFLQSALPVEAVRFESRTWVNPGRGVKDA